MRLIFCSICSTKRSNSKGPISFFTLKRNTQNRTILIGSLFNFFSQELQGCRNSFHCAERVPQISRLCAGIEKRENVGSARFEFQIEQIVSRAFIVPPNPHFLKSFANCLVFAFSV